MLFIQTKAGAVTFKSAASDNPSTRLSSILLFILLALCCWVSFGNSLHADFILDDGYTIVYNPVIKQPSLYPEIFTGGLFQAYASSDQFKLSYYRPLTLLTFAADYQLWGLNPAGYRLVNILLHLINAWLIYRLVARLFKKQELGFLAALIFCILPIHEGTVNHIIGRCDLLQTFFLLCASLTFVTYLQRRSMGYFALCLACYLAAILSREVGIIFPFMALVICMFHSPSFKKAFKMTLPFFMVGVFYSLVRMFVFPVFKGQEYQALGSKAMDSILLVADFAGRFLFSKAVVSQVPAGVSLAILMALLVLFGGGFLLNMILKRPSLCHAREIRFGFWIMVIGLLPIVFLKSIVLRLGPYLSEYLLYLPAIGFAILLSGVVIAFPSYWRKLTVTLLFLYYSGFLFYSSFFWTTEEMTMRRFFELEKNYDTIAGMQLLAKYDDNGEEIEKRIQGAKGNSMKSIWLKRAGSMTRKNKNPEKAAELLKEAIAMNPSYAEAYLELAAVYLETGKVEEGMAAIKKVLSFDAKNAEAHRILGIVLYRNNMFVAASEHLKKSAFYNPDHLESSLYLAMAYLLSDDDRAYQKTLATIFRRKNDVKTVYHFVCQELYDHGYFLKTVSLINASQNILADDRQSLNFLGLSYMKMGEHERSREVWRRILELYPGDSQAESLLRVVGDDRQH